MTIQDVVQRDDRRRVDGWSEAIRYSCLLEDVKRLAAPEGRPEPQITCGDCGAVEKEWNTKGCPRCSGLGPVEPSAPVTPEPPSLSNQCQARHGFVRCQGQEGHSGWPHAGHYAHWAEGCFTSWTSRLAGGEERPTSAPSAPEGRTLKDYRPQHDEGCPATICECGLNVGRDLYVAHFHAGYKPSAPCACGLSALLAVSHE